MIIFLPFEKSLSFQKERKIYVVENNFYFDDKRSSKIAFLCFVSDYYILLLYSLYFTWLLLNSTE